MEEINARVNAVCVALRQEGVKPGDRVLVHSRNNIALLKARGLRSNSVPFGFLQTIKLHLRRPLI